MISNSGQTQILNNQTGSGREGLNFEPIKNFVFSLPNDINEQKQIIETVDLETSKINTLMEKNNLAIHKLQEYKTSLISAVVTGKIKVSE